MLEFKKGNEENLEGRVIVYAKLKSKDGKGIQVIHKQGDEEYPIHIEEGHIFALFLATNPTDFKEKTGIPDSYFDETSKKVNEVMEEIGKKTGKKPEITPVYSASIPVSSEIDLKIAQEDVLFAGNYSNPELCIHAINLGTQFYLIAFHEQLERNHDLNSYQEEHPSVTYKDFEGESIKSQIIETYLVPMICAQEQEEYKKFREIKREFIRFSAKAPFFTDTLDLCKAISDSGRKVNTDLIDALVAKIVAVHTEDYESAREIRDRIRELTK